MPTVRVYILLLNWNGWKDTIECLESVFRLDYPDFRVIVCDNASGDDSLSRIKSWARGELAASPCQVPLRSSGVNLSKPIAYAEYDRAHAETGADLNLDVPLVLIQTGDNLGFAGGNNVGLRYALACGDSDYVWVLNNDTVVEPDALTHMVERMRVTPNAGMCGATLIFYYRPDMIQAWGGSAFNERKGYVTPIGMFQKADDPVDITAIESRTAYVVGASMLVSRKFLHDVGLMSEDYFLFYEELDWAYRARGKFTLVYSAASHVYHKEGGSIGSSSTQSQSMLAVRLLYRNRIRFARKFNRANLGGNLVQIAWEFLVMMKRRQFRAVYTAFVAVVRELCRSPILNSGSGSVVKK